MPSLKRTSIVDEVVRLCTRDILNSVYKPGQELTEERLTEDFDISRATARAGIVALSYAGFLRREPNKPATVQILTSEAVAYLFRVRRPVELEAVRLLTRKKETTVPRQAYERLDELDALQADASQADLVEANVGFHKALIGGVHNPPLVRCFETLEGEIKLAIAQSGVADRFENASAEHRHLVDLISRKQWVASRDAMLAHLKSSGLDISSRLKVRELDKETQR